MTDRTASGRPLVVGRGVGQALDLAHDVVAQVADQAAVQRAAGRAATASGRPPAGPRRAASMPRSRGMRGRELAVDVEPAVAQRRAWPTGRGRRRRSGPSARRARPTRAGTRVASPTTRGEGGDGCGEVGEHLPPDGHDRVVGRQLRERPPYWARSTEGTGRSSCTRRCGRRPCPPARRRTAARRRRSRSTPP